MGNTNDKLREAIGNKNRTKFNIPVPSDIKFMKDVFVENGFKLFVVGGAVRDALLHMSPKDWDLATDATPDEVERIMGNAGLRTIPTGKSFGVINVLTENDEHEVATFRKDIGSGRRPDSVEFTTIEEDVKRRDLTINALFFDIDTSEIVDLVGGISDLKNGIIRTVGKAEERFGEDRLRILRAIRFAGRFGSELEPEIEVALMNDSSLEGISPERIRDEFLKGIKTAKSVKHFLSLLDKFELWDSVFPNLIVDSTVRVNDKDPIIIIANLLNNNDPDILTKVLNKLTFSSTENKAITFLIKLKQFDDVNDVVMFKKLHNKSGVDDIQIFKFGMLVELPLDAVQIGTFVKFKLTVTGQEATDKLGVAKGPEMGVAIKKLETDNFKALL